MGAAPYGSTTLLFFASSMLGSALSGMALTLAWQRLKKKPRDPETDYSVGHELVWNNIRGALGAAMLYVGDRLDLYRTLRTLCSSSDTTSGVTAVELATETGLHVRWLREWLAQQAAMGALLLLPGTGDTDQDLVYRLPTATAQVLANPDSCEYDVSMVHMVPTLVHRAQVMIPQAMQTGLGWPYNSPEVATAIDRQHARHIRHVFLPKVLPRAWNGRILQLLEQGCHVCDLGCGAGGLLIALAERYPKSTFHGFDISAVALQKATYTSLKNKLRNVTWHDANQPGQSLGDFANQFDVALTYDVLHDCTQPSSLIAQVKTALKTSDNSDTGFWLLADLPAEESVRANLAKIKAPDTYYGISLCLCMSCSLSEPNGAGLGTLGFSIPVAQQLLTQGGFCDIQVLLEEDNVRWFQVQ